MERNKLCAEIERAAGRAIETPRDFDWLARLIFTRTREMVSPSTLKRLWGYFDGNVQPRRFTMNVLARFAGYTDYEAFERHTGDADSNLVLARRLSADDITCGRRLRLTWPPDRVCEIEHQGYGRFVIVRAENTKLSVGDTFTCHLFIEREPLFLDNLVHCGGTPTAYVAGRDNGVMFELE